MFPEQLRTLRLAHGLSQQALADKLHVVRQTVSKWEQGLSVPDADLLLALSRALETPVGVLLEESSESPTAKTEGQVDRAAEALAQVEALRGQLARKKAQQRARLHGLCIALCVVVIAGFAALVKWKSPYLRWDYSRPETAVIGVALHALEWLGVRCAPLLLLGAAAGIVLTRKKA